VSEDWVALGDAVTKRMRERRITQKKLAELSKVSTATIRHIQLHTGHHRHGARTLEALSEALDWPPSHLDNVLNGRGLADAAGAADTGNEDEADQPTLQDRLSSLEEQLRKLSVILEQRFGDVVDIIYNSGSGVDVTIEIRHK